jgi:hypothetical protein
MDRLLRMSAAPALAALTIVIAAGCGGEKTDVSEGVENLNERLSQQAVPAKLECPDEVDGAEGTEFDCDLKASEGDKSQKVKMEISKEGDDYVVDVKDQASFERALATVVGQQGTQQQQQGGQQPGQGGQQPPQQPEQQPQQPTP